MKHAITITEPYASFIRQGIKKIETRSRPTKYRGTIYIHASKRDIPTEWKRNITLMRHLVEPPQYGMVIAKAELVDCIRMTKGWVENIRKNEPLEYELGFYEEGRYAYILQDVEPVQPFPAKGQLCIGWKIKEE